MKTEQDEKWQRLKDVFSEALEIDRRKWPAYLLTHCGDDVDLFLEVTSLLAVERSLGNFIETPVADRLFPSPRTRSDSRDPLSTLPTRL